MTAPKPPSPLRQLRVQATAAELRAAFLERVVATMALKTPLGHGTTLLGTEGQLDATLYPGGTVSGPLVVTIHRWAGASNPNVQAWTLEEWLADASQRVERFGAEAYHAELQLAVALSGKQESVPCAAGCGTTLAPQGSRYGCQEEDCNLPICAPCWEGADRDRCSRHAGPSAQVAPCAVETVNLCRKCGGGLTSDGRASFPLRFGRPSSTACAVGGRHEPEVV